MSSKILTYNVTSIGAFMHDPRGVMNDAEGGIVAVFTDNALGFYAITPARLAHLIELEARPARPASDMATLNTQFFEEVTTMPAAVHMGKFAMHSGWKPDVDFQRQAALWGISLMQPVTPEELVAFITWWQAEGKVFTHIQWQQKLARSVQIRRASSSKLERNINAFAQPDTQIPHGFRGVK